MGMYRKKYINTPIKKVIEALIFAFVTSSTFYAVVVWRQNVCNTIPSTESGELRIFTCPTDEYNPLATLIFNTEGGTLKQLFRFPSLMEESV
jgi:hypothetical protein